MKITMPKLWLHWLYMRRYVLAYVAALYGLFFLVFGLYGYPWGVAGYPALLGAVGGLGLALADFAHFAGKYKALAQLPGLFPTGELPQPDHLLEATWAQIVTQLEAERRRVTNSNEATRRDAEEYYTLWAHQIKTPLAAMRLLLQSSNQPIPQPQRAGLEQELLRIEQYVEMVLQYQRLSSIQSDLALQPVALEELVKQAAKNCAPIFIYKKLALDVQPLAGSIVTDKKWFVFVLEQLYSNAVKYTAKGQIKVYQQNAHTLVIEDTGVGIAPDDLPRVFERGFTGATGRKERSSTGIGLYLCRQIMQRLGFGITLQSCLGKGTKVLLHLRQQHLQTD